MINSARYVSALVAVQLAACSAQPASNSEETRVLAGPTSPAANVPAAAQTKQQERLVLALGDSLYAGFGVDQSQSLPAVLERELAARGIRARVVNAGVSGDTTAGGRRRLAFTLDGLKRAPDLAIVGLGANDALRGLDPAETRRNLDAILAELNRRGIPVLITGMLAPRNLDSAYIGSFEAIYPELADKHDARLDPFLLEGVITRRELLLPDGMHPNARGIEHIAKRLAPGVAAELQKARRPAKAA